MEESSYSVGTLIHTSNLYVGVKAPGVEGPICELPGFYALHFEVIVVDYLGQLVPDVPVIVSVRPLPQQPLTDETSSVFDSEAVARSYETGYSVQSATTPVKCSVDLPVVFKLSEITATISDTKGTE
jgi:hypothetical protein